MRDQDGLRARDKRDKEGMETRKKILKKFRQLVSRGCSVHLFSGWTGFNYKQDPEMKDYLRFRVEVLNLVRRACGEDSDHYKELNRLANIKDPASNTHSYYLQHFLGVLEAAYDDYKDSMLFDVRALIAAELLGGFIEQAELLVREGYHIPAASLAGAVLEDALRKLCKARGLLHPEKTSIDRLNADLAKAGVYDKLTHKRITALADIRNNADHGHFRKFSSEDVEDMVKWVRRFAADYLK